MTQQELENLLHTQIPLSKFMQVQVVKANASQVELVCALGPNHNHLGTAFGGSLSCLMILAAYCQLFQMIDSSGHVVVKTTKMEFLLPVQEDLRAICHLPAQSEVQKFMDAYSKKGKGRLNLESQIVLKDGRTACKLEAEFIGKA